MEGTVSTKVLKWAHTVHVQGTEEAHLTEAQGVGA